MDGETGFRGNDKIYLELQKTGITSILRGHSTKKNECVIFKTRFFNRGNGSHYNLVRLK